MKRLIFVVLILSITTAGLAALEVNVTMAAGGKLSGGFGTWASENDPLVVDDSYGGNGYKPGFTFTGGGVFELRFGQRFSLETDILFSYTSAGYYTILPPGDTMKTSILTLEVPILAKFLYKGFFIGAGPDFIIPLGPMKTKAPDDSITEADMSFAFGITGTLGYSFAVGPGNLTFEMRYTRPLTPLLEDVLFGKIYFNRFDFMVGYLFCL